MYLTNSRSSCLASSCTATYFPATSGIVPMMVPDLRDLQIAVTMNSWAWSILTIFGGVFAGSLAAKIGIQMCFLIDFGTFWLSAVALYCGVKGSYKGKTSSVQQTTGATTAEDNAALPGENAWTRKLKGTFQVFKELSVYLPTCGFGMTVLLKSSATFVGALKILSYPNLPQCSSKMVQKTK